MEFDLWIIWLILAALFIIGEIFTAGFFILWFGIGAAVAAVLAFLNVSAGWQLAAFVVVSLTLFLVSRKFASRVTKEQPPGIGADRFLEKQCTVLEEINNAKNSGRVRLKTEEWRAQSEDGSIIPQEALVSVVRVDGTHLIVKSL
jgi:inner membrane protein